MDTKSFVKEWEDGWNSHDLNRIMSHYRDDIVFRSQKAIALTGSGQIVGAKALKAYWSIALERQQNLHFTVQDVFEGHEMLVIQYRNHQKVLACETLYFDSEGRIFQAAACHR